MGLFKKKERPIATELKCPAEGCPFTCNDPESLRRHVDWKHPQLVENVKKSKE